jgi:hypothetical protein
VKQQKTARRTKPVTRTANPPPSKRTIQRRRQELLQLLKGTTIIDIVWNDGHWVVDTEGLGRVVSWHLSEDVSETQVRATQKPAVQP